MLYNSPGANIPVSNYYTQGMTAPPVGLLGPGDFPSVDTSGLLGFTPISIPDLTGGLSSSKFDVAASIEAQKAANNNNNNRNNTSGSNGDGGQGTGVYIGEDGVTRWQGPGDEQHESLYPGHVYATNKKGVGGLKSLYGKGKEDHTKYQNQLRKGMNLDAGVTYKSGDWKKLGIKAVASSLYYDGDVDMTKTADERMDKAMKDAISIVNTPTPENSITVGTAIADYVDSLDD